MIEVVCAVIEDRHCGVLACRRDGARHLGGKWEFPGGKVEPGETKAEALAREIHEELGVVVEVGEAMGVVEWRDSKVAIRLIPFRCRVTAGVIRPTEHEELRWCRLDQLDDLDWAPADLPIVAELKASAWGAEIRPE